MKLSRFCAGAKGRFDGDLATRALSSPFWRRWTFRLSAARAGKDALAESNANTSHPLAAVARRTSSNQKPRREHLREAGTVLGASGTPNGSRDASRQESLTSCRIVARRARLGRSRRRDGAGKRATARHEPGPSSRHGLAVGDTRAVEARVRKALTSNESENPSLVYFDFMHVCRLNLRR